jgi:integrase
LVRAGLAEARTNKSTGKGRNTKRQHNELSFHCLRHTATSWLKNAGVSDSVARELMGHESAAVSRRYTHLEDQVLRAAVDKMPDVLASDLNIE